MATAGAVEPEGGNKKGKRNREGTAKSTVTEKISQAVQSRSSVLHLIQQSSPPQVFLTTFINTSISYQRHYFYYAFDCKF